jgi:hypothetical protein
MVRLKIGVSGVLLDNIFDKLELSEAPPIAVSTAG